METMGKITVFLIALTLSILTFFLGAKVILSVANMYDLKFICSFSFVQIVGILGIVSILKYNYKETESKSSNKKYKDQIFDAIQGTASTALTYLIMWGLSWLYLVILK